TSLMLSRIATVLQELSGEEGPDGDAQLPAGEGQHPAESEPPEEVMERLAHLEQLVVQLKGLIRDKDTQLIQKDTELFEARFMKLKLQAKAKMASLNKQITDLKGQAGAVVKLIFLVINSSSLHAAQKRCEELEETLNSRSQVLEMLQQEVSSADQQKQVKILDSFTRWQIFHTPTHIFLSVSLAAQILTAHFRQMEQELAEAVKQREEERQQWAERANGADAEMAAVRISLEALSAEVAKQESELVFLRQAEHVSQEALEKEKVEVARLERELALMKEAELVAVQASQDAAEGDRAELVRLENELAFMRDKVDCASRDASEREKSEVEKLEQELASLKEEREDAQKKQEILTEIWRHLQPLAAEDVQREEECPLPADHSLFLHTVHSVETQLMKLKEERNNSREHCVELTHAMETLQGKRMYLAETQANCFEEELKLAREEMEKLSQQSSSVGEKNSVEIQLLEEQIDNLNTEAKAKEEKIQDLQNDLETARQALCEQAGRVRILSVQLEDREHLSSELERRVTDMESSILEYSQISELSNDTLSKKDCEISELQLRLSLKEQEVVELNDSMSAKLLQAEEEKFQIDSEVSQLKEQIVELEKVRDEKEKVSCEESAAHVDDELAGLRQEKGLLETQVTNIKKKLQVALVQRKELMKKVADLEAEATKRKQQDETAMEKIPEVEQPWGSEIEEMEAKLIELEQALRSKEEEVVSLEQKISQQDQTLIETLALNKKLSEEAENSQQSDMSSETTLLQSQVTSLESECESLQKKVQEAQESRKETIRKAKEKDRHHREQLKQQKEEYSELMERFEVQSGEREVLLSKVRELEEKVSAEREGVSQQEPVPLAENVEKQVAGDWVQEDWVDFALLKVGKELQALQDKESQIDALSEEIHDLREKHCQAESYAEALKAEMEATAKAASADSVASIAFLQAEVEEFKHFLDNKNHEIMELGQQLSEQNSLIHSMQDTVSQKDQLISSLQEELKAEEEKTQRLEVEFPKKQEEEKDSEAKIQQLQRKLQAALISRKEALKESKTQKEQLASTEMLIAELKQKMEAAEDELEKLRAERIQLIDEVDRTLLENQSLGSSCESLKLAMEGILNEKDACKKEAELLKEEAATTSREWEEKVQGMKDEYETLLKSYENVSDEAERVRRVLEAARQERQELAVRMRTHEVAKQEAERQAEEAKKEVDSVKDKMRKFAKTKQQKILELEEENERLREMQEKTAIKRENKVVKADVERLQDELGAVKAELDASVAERDSLGQQIEELKEKLSRHEEKSITTEQADQVAVVELASLEQDLEDSKEKEGLVASLEKCLQENKERENSLIEEGSKREAQFKELFRSLENEKDNLEERLMNQLAQLNGSIAGYQQEAADNREHLAELQREVERLQREQAELEAKAQSESDRAARLEEDMRQAQRERAEAEAESGKQRELQQQLRSAQRVKEGSQSRVRQLEELLREKQLEVRQLQKDCIQYQERISELGKEAKALQLGHDELLNKLEKFQVDSFKTAEDLKRTEAELANCKSQLHEAQQEVRKALAEKTSLEQKAQQREALMKAEAEQTLDSVRFRLGAELKEMELRLEDAYSEREKEEEATLEAREMAERAEARAQETQARLDESLARLAAFSRCMSSLQDDRDRVLDETRQWETRFNDALQGKEAEVREAETRAKELAEQLQRESALKEELQLSQTTDELQSAQNEARALQKEVESFLQRARALEEAVARLQGEVDQARTELREREGEERRLGLNVEQLETDLHSSKALTESLQAELNEKEKREMEMLGEKEQAVTEVVLCFHLQYRLKEAESRAQGAEEELEQRRGELRDLEEKLRKAEEESNIRKARLDSFMKAMGSLQDDRDRVLNTYKQLEEKHLQVMMEKDALIQEAAGENNSLKEELRSLLVQRDDLHAEKAKLSAQLHGYRDELKQVLSMKDSQHKQLLAAQRERIASLEKECKELQSQLVSISKARESEVEAGKVERETLSQALDLVTVPQLMDAPGAEVEKLREQLQAAREQVEALKESLLQEKQEHESKSKELAELRWEGGVMRTESESAQERVAELAQDLLAVEQKLLGEKELTKQLMAENESFSKAMASLQDSRDQAVDKVQELSVKMDEMSKAGGHAAQSILGGTTGEVWGLKNALQALQNDRERLRIDWMAQAEQLKQQTLATLSDREQQLRQLSTMLEEARAHGPKLLQEQYQREAGVKTVSTSNSLWPSLQSFFCSLSPTSLIFFFFNTCCHIKYEIFFQISGLSIYSFTNV
uniref:Uncharacterized protein n=1 Tax=Mola mola TaxID=94237 RepID=A0A3Q3VIV5_MOLML